MTDVGEYTDVDFAEIWEQMRVAESQTDKLSIRLDELHSSLDKVLAELSEPQTKAQPEKESDTTTI